MKRKMFVVILVVGFLLPTFSQGFTVSQEITGTITIDIKHHNPKDLTITVGYLEITKGYIPLTSTPPTESKIIWDKEDSPISDGIRRSYNLGIFGFESIKKLTKDQIIWIIEIQDLGTRHLKENLTEEEQMETGNYLVGFFLTINNLTYRSFHHPFIDDGVKVRAEIYEIEEMIVKDSTILMSWPRVLGVIGVSKFAYTSQQLNVQDANTMITEFTLLAIENEIEPYDMIWVIDSGMYQTNDRIYISTVDSLFESIDYMTNGYSNVVLFTSSHGDVVNILGITHPYMWVYNTRKHWWIFPPSNPYYSLRIADYLEGMTEEGTDIFTWLGHCRSAAANWMFQNVVIDTGWHLIFYAYYPNAYTDKSFKEMQSFFYSIRSQQPNPSIEDMFTPVSNRFHYYHPNDYMYLWDYFDYYGGEFYL